MRLSTRAGIRILTVFTIISSNRSSSSVSSSLISCTSRRSLFFRRVCFERLLELNWSFVGLNWSILIYTFSPNDFSSCTDGMFFQTLGICLLETLGGTFHSYHRFLLFELHVSTLVRAVLVPVLSCATGWLRASFQYQLLWLSSTNYPLLGAVFVIHCDMSQRLIVLSLGLRILYRHASYT